MAAPPEACWTTTVLSKNIHCSSCVAYIHDVLSRFGQDVCTVNVSILCQTVAVRHRTSLKPQDLCTTLTRSAFDVLSSSTDDDQGRRIEHLDYISADGWLQQAQLENWHIYRSNSSARRALHIQNCFSCQTEESMGPAFVTRVAKPRAVQLRSTKPRRQQVDGAGSSLKDQTISDSSRTVGSHTLTLLIGGMTCSSCSNAITAALKELHHVIRVEVSLISNSAVVVYKGSDEEARLIVSTVEDVGFDASIEDSGSEDSSSWRTVMVKIDGMFSDHCPRNIVERLESDFLDHLNVLEAPSMKSPTLKLRYKPAVGFLTIRDIVGAIHGVDKKLSSHVYHPPSLEDRSQLMQMQELKRVLKRLFICSVFALPTFLIGVVWMNIVSSSNSARKYFDQAVLAGTVSRAQWALAILATPVMFGAADIFHVRAFKGIRAMWRRKSQVPILRRFYHFGSMNLLISAGTSVAYIASVALLIRGTTMPKTLGSHNTTYFDSVVFLTFFILMGKSLELYSKAKTGNAVAMLGKLRPQEAVLVNDTSAQPDTVSQISENDSNSKDGEVALSSSQRISADLLEIGDMVYVNNGSSPPADGKIADGSSTFNESSLTGESQDVSKSEGDKVFAGTINTGNSVKVVITGLGGKSMLDQVIAAVREGQTKSAPVERIVDTITGFFVPVITALAITTFIVWFSLGQSGSLSPRYIAGKQGGWAFWSLEFAIAVFVVACPCGIGLAAPTALFVGGGLAAKSGILVRGGGEAFEEASRVDAVVFDKTGTLTEGGNRIVTDHQILAEGQEKDIVWSVTASLEERSQHPLARALLSITSSGTKPLISTQSFTEEPGRGLRGTFGVPTSANISTMYEAAIGSEAYVTSLEQMNPLGYFITNTLSQWKSQSKSIALLALRQTSTSTEPIDGQQPAHQPWHLAAIFAISDPIRPSAAPTVSALQARGIPVYMLTGDNPSTASAVASTLSIPADRVFAGVLPTEKADKIEWLKENGTPRGSSSHQSWPSRLLRRKTHAEDSEKKKTKANIAFVGDGINDAPALACATVSIAISSPSSSTASSPAQTSSDIAISSASFVLLSPSLETVLTLFKLSEKVFRRIKFNFAWAVVYNAILVPMAAGVFFGVKEGGWRMSPVWASLAMAGSSLSVLASSLAMGWEWEGVRAKGKEVWGFLNGLWSGKQD
ncbi:MAG: hypothetical protein Q9219_003016 [cf. Caloplaca sp. 3 TL-2023]